MTEFLIPHFTGKAWVSDYGNPDDPDDFDFIFPISPLHNIPKDKILPPTMLLTADRTS
jgi:prolyl oligopeptidase